MSKFKQMSKKKKIVIVGIEVVLLVLIGIIVKMVFFNNTSDEAKKLEAYFEEDKLILIEENDKYGYISSQGKKVIDFKYKKATEFNGDYAIVTEDGENYYIVDKTGKAMIEPTSRYNIEYVAEADAWVIDDCLYDSNLKKVTSDEVEIEYAGDKYFAFTEENGNNAGIITADGKETYSYKFGADESYFNVEVADNDDLLKEHYCRINIDNEKYGIVSCDNGKVIVDISENYIVVEDDNIFNLYKGTYRDSGSPVFEKSIYIENGKIAYESNNANIEFYNLENKILEVESRETYDEQYYDLKNKKMLDERPSYSTSKDILETLLGYTKYSCSAGYGIMKDKEVIVECGYNRIDTLPINVYEYVKQATKKEIILAKKDEKVMIINLKNGKVINSFDYDYVDTDDDSIFIEIEQEDDKVVVYNLITGKSMEFNDVDDCEMHSNYFIIEYDDVNVYYNTSFKKIYSLDK